MQERTKGKTGVGENRKKVIVSCIEKSNAKKRQVRLKNNATLSLVLAKYRTM